MSPEQLVVLALLAAAFVAGWVARGGDRNAAPAVGAGDGDDVSEAAGGDTAPDASLATGDGRSLQTATAAYTAAVDAWLDRGSPDGLLTVFDTARAAVSDPDAAAALADAADVLGGFRAGRPMTADDSRRLEAVERRLGVDA